MSCPDWQAVCRRHEAAPNDAKGRVGDAKRRFADAKRRVADDALEWRAALRHLDECPACQAAAPSFDPTLLFRRLPALEVGRDDVEAMKQAVAGMRRGQEIEHRGSPARHWLQAAAVAAVLLGSLMLRGAGPRDGVQTLPQGDGLEVAAPAASLVPPESEIDLWRMPLIETADPAWGSIIQVVDDDISVVLVVADEVDV